MRRIKFAPTRAAALTKPSPNRPAPLVVVFSLAVSAVIWASIYNGFRLQSHAQLATKSVASATNVSTSTPQGVVASSAETAHTDQPSQPSSSSAATPVTTKSPSSNQNNSTATINVSEPGGQLKIGETSGVYNLSMSNNKTVIWTIIGQYPSPIYVADQHFSPSPTNSFVVRTNLPPTAYPGTFVVNIEAYDPAVKKVIATKTINVTLTAQEAIAVSFYGTQSSIDESIGTTCIPYTVTALASNVNLDAVEVSADIVEGDQNSAYVVLTQNCVQIYVDPQAPAGDRRIKLSATYAGHTASDTFLISITAG